MLSWVRERLDRVNAGAIAQLGERLDASWRRRVQEKVYDPVREMQMFGDLLQPSPDELMHPAPAPARAVVHACGACNIVSNCQRPEAREHHAQA
ncbi:MAG: hypothetical protein H6Q89_2360 [Myxococcaceae bacterium]|nr:hypothetical protein [Myxococcaceae bacterium]